MEERRLNVIRVYGPRPWDDDIVKAIKWNEDVSTIAPESLRPAGKWVHGCECSVCGEAYGPKNKAHMRHYRYCPNCGAKMEESK